MGATQKYPLVGASADLLRQTDTATVDTAAAAFFVTRYISMYCSHLHAFTATMATAAKLQQHNIEIYHIIKKQIVHCHSTVAIIFLSNMGKS